MHGEPESKHGPWLMYFTAALLSLPVWYVLSSGPIKIAFEEFGWTAATHERVYAPLVWLDDNTPANGVVARYWELFPTSSQRWNINRGEYRDEYDVVGRAGRGDRAINRNLRVGE
jgi:hypothetical protein